MRIKCPNTDVYLDLPTDSPEITFNCPACHRVHRITVAISSSDDLDTVPDGQTRATVSPHMEVYSPTSQFSRNAEDGVSPRASLPDPDQYQSTWTRPTQIHDIHDRDTADSFAGAQPTAASGIRDQGVLPSSSTGKRLLGYFLVIAVLAGLGYLGWEQYKYQKLRSMAESYLAWADGSWKNGDIPSAADAARQAAETLEESRSLRCYTTLLGLSASDDMNARINRHMARQDAFIQFRNQFNPADDFAPALLAQSVEGAVDGGDKFFAMAMQQTAKQAVLDHLHTTSLAITPEDAIGNAVRLRETYNPLLPPEIRSQLAEQLDAFTEIQYGRLRQEISGDIAAIGLDAVAGHGFALDRYHDLTRRIEGIQLEDLSRPIADLAENRDRESMLQLSRLDEIIGKATRYARSAYSRVEEDDRGFDLWLEAAADDTRPNAAMAEAAVKKIEALQAEADDLLRIRGEIFSRLQSEMRRNRDYAGTRLMWSMLRVGFDDEEVEIDPASISYDTSSARISFRFHGLPVEMQMTEEDYEATVRATVDGIDMSAGWTLLFHKPLVWMSEIAHAMRQTGVDVTLLPAWEVVEGPGAPLAISVPRKDEDGDKEVPNNAPATRYVFFSNELHPITDTPVSEDTRGVVEEFRQAAIQLHDGIMADASIALPLRNALKPVLMGTFQTPDPRDYFDSDFCRRLIEADYLESFINPMPEDRQRELDRYRETLGRLEAGHDEFFVEMGANERLYAVANLEPELAAADNRSGDQDPETGESLPRYNWRWELPDQTVFFSPLPSRYVYSFMLAEQYDGVVKTRPPGRPAKTEVWHATKGLVASYRSGDAKAEGDAELWNQAVAGDLRGRNDPSMGSPGWNFPLHVLERDDQGDPLVIATLSGTIPSPDFTDITDDTERRLAEDAWLDATAATFTTPGELGLIFHQFFRYCSDSPLPELPNLIGSHYGLSDTHQTVYESLERRWVGRLIGDCDDLAEFFQELTRRQGKLSHVMQLPGHAACGYVEPVEDGDGYRFVILQTGPVTQYVAPTLNQVVEVAYRSFDREGGIAHFTTDAVPLLLRFANEETRTPFVLSARIYGDAEYAATMIEVQSYWHEHAFSAALRIMEDMVEEDQEIGNIKELGSLYERVGMYDNSETMRLMELDMVRDNVQASISTYLELVQLYFQQKEHGKALEALESMEMLMMDMVRRDDAGEFFRAMTFRSYWALYMARLGQAARAWELVRFDAVATKAQMGRIAEPVLRTMVLMYDRLCKERDELGGSLPTAETAVMEEMGKELEEAFGRGYFRNDDSYNSIIRRYFLLGKYAVAETGRENGLDLLLQDGPYPDGPRNHVIRRRAIDEQDWQWMRITPQLYLALAMEMLDEDEFPDLYDPEAAKPLLEYVSRAVERGSGLGSDVTGGDDLIRADVTLAFINRDLEAFRELLAVVKDKNYASLYDDIALTVGLQCGLIPLADFPAWIEAFRDGFADTQHYFKVVYRAIDKENYDHALVMAEATAAFFPDNVLLTQEAAFIEYMIPELKARKTERESPGQTPAEPEDEPAISPAA